MATNLILKNKDITIGNVIGSRSFIGGQKYYIVNSAMYDGQEFKPGSKFVWVDSDEDEFTEYVGIIKEIFVLNNGDVEINHDLMIGRLSLEDLILIENNTNDVNEDDERKAYSSVSNRYRAEQEAANTSAYVQAQEETYFDSFCQRNGI